MKRGSRAEPPFTPPAAASPPAAAPPAPAEWSSVSDWLARPLLGWPADLAVALADRPPLPSWLCPAMLASLPARARLAAWARTTPAARWDDPPETVETLIPRIESVGDETLLAPLAETLQRLPPPLRAHALASCCFVLVTRAIHGWCSGAIVTAKPFTLVLSAAGSRAAFADLCAHEISHSWIEPHPPGPAPGALAASAWFTYPEIPPDLIDRARGIRRRLDVAEARANALTDALKFGRAVDAVEIAW